MQGDYSTGINDAGQVVGYSLVAGGYTHAFVTGSNGKGLTDLGTLGGGSSFAYAINNRGQVTGAYVPAGGTNYQAFISAPDGGTLMNIVGGSNTYGYGINDHGQVVGQSADASTNLNFGFIYSEGTFTDLNTLIDAADAAHILITDAVAINEKGLIAAVGVDSQDGQHAYMLIPVARVNEQLAALLAEVTAIGPDKELA